MEEFHITINSISSIESNNFNDTKSYSISKISKLKSIKSHKERKPYIENSNINRIQRIYKHINAHINSNIASVLGHSTRPAEDKSETQGTDQKYSKYTKDNLYLNVPPLKNVRTRILDYYCYFKEFNLHNFNSKDLFNLKWNYYIENCDLIVELRPEIPEYAHLRSATKWISIFYMVKNLLSIYYIQILFKFSNYLYWVFGLYNMYRIYCKLKCVKYRFHLNKGMVDVTKTEDGREAWVLANCLTINRHKNKYYNKISLINMKYEERIMAYLNTTDNEYHNAYSKIKQFFSHSESVYYENNISDIEDLDNNDEVKDNTNIINGNINKNKNKNKAPSQNITNNMNLSYEDRKNCLNVTRNPLQKPIGFNEFKF